MTSDGESEWKGGEGGLDGMATIDFLLLFSYQTHYEYAPNVGELKRLSVCRSLV